MANLGWEHEEIDHLYNTSCGCHSLDANGVFVHINQTELQWLGYQQHDLIGTKLTELLTPASRKIFETNFSRLEAERSLHDLELEFFRRDGTILWVVLNAIAVRDKHHNRPMSSSILFDITDRKRMEEALRDSEERFRKVFQEGPLGFSLVGRDHRFFKVNDALCRMVGYEPQELTVMSFEDITHPEDRQSDSVLAEQLFRGEIPFYQILKRHVRKNGEIIWTNLTRSVIRDREGEPLYALAMSEDITARKRTDEALRISEERFRVALKNSPVVVFTQDLELRYTWINSPVLAWAEQDYIGRTDIDVVGGRDGEQLMAIKRAVLENGVGSRTEPIVTFNGETHYYDLTVEPMRDSTGAIQGVTCSATDITPMKRAAAERENMIEELAQGQRKLMERNRELEVLYNERTRWLGMANHDLRNPLSGILANCELLIGDAAMFSEDHRKLLKSIYSSSQFMLGLLNDVLDISAIESGWQEFRFESTDVRSVVEESVDLSRPLARRKGTRIEVVHQASTPNIVMDRPKMQQVLLNLIGNAIQFSQNDASVQITVFVQPDNILITVRDNGPGIPPDELGSVFTAFHSTRARAASPEEKGTGLGLAICKRIVERHGGKIWVESTPGKGAAFHLSLPL